MYGGPDLSKTEPVEVVATVIIVNHIHVVALCPAGFLHYHKLSSAKDLFKQLLPGDLVKVHHTGGYNPELITLELLSD